MHEEQLILAQLDRLKISRQRNPKLRDFCAMLSELPEIEKIDHCAFISPSTMREAFLRHWAHGYQRHGVWETIRYPAQHLALVRGGTPDYPWTDMLGLTVSEGSNEPLERSLRLGSELSLSPLRQLQHIAFNVHPAAAMPDLRSKLEQRGLRFMTPILSYEDQNGAGLSQMFSAPAGYFFYEFVQRRCNAAQEPFAGFNPAIVDDLYAALDVELRSQVVSTTSDAIWVPQHVYFVD